LGVHTPASRAASTKPARAEIDVLALIDHLVLGGAEMLLGQFAAAAPSVGIKLSVTCLEERDGNPAAAQLHAAGISPLNLNVPGRVGLRTLGKVRRHIARRRPDLVHTHLGTSDALGSLAARSLGIPVVSTIHTVVWGRDPETYAKRMLVRFCDARIIAVSDSARAVYAKRGWAGERQLVTIHNGVDVTPMPGAGRELRDQLGWAAEDLVVGMVSALRPEKAHDVALGALTLLMDQFPALRLLIVGEGPARDSISRLARDLGDRVAMIGRRADVMRCFDALDVCLHPSRADAFPTTLIEAMAASVPVLATDVGGVPEIVVDGETGVLVPAPPSAAAVAVALAALLRDPPRRLALAGAARAAYQDRFTAAPWLCKTRSMYDSVLAESSSPPGPGAGPCEFGRSGS
jgi:glycosyltransferase involved in cell wall biosynthesis